MMINDKPIPTDIEERAKEINRQKLIEATTLRELTQTEKTLIDLILNNTPRKQCIEILNLSNEAINRLINDYTFRSGLKKATTIRYNNKTPYERLSDVKRKAIDLLRQGYTLHEISKNNYIGMDSMKYWIKTDKNFKKLYDEILLQK